MQLRNSMIMRGNVLAMKSIPRLELWELVEKFSSCPNYMILKRFRDRQTTNTNTCGWAVFLHVDFLFRDAHDDKTNTNTNTTPRPGETCSTSSFSFLFDDYLDKTLKWTIILWIATVLLPQGRAPRSHGVSNFNFDERLDHDRAHAQTAAFCNGFSVFLSKRDVQASKDTDRSFNLELQKTRRLERGSSDNPATHRRDPVIPRHLGPDATQPYSTCVQAHSRSLRIPFLAEFAPFFFHSRKVNS